MSDIELVVNKSKALEALLEDGLGATGKGLHEKVSSVQTRLPEALVRKLRFVATLRNKLIHDTDYAKLDDRPAFERACADAERELRALVAPARVTSKGCFGVVLFFGSAVLLAAWRWV